MTKETNATGALAVGGMAAILASPCCLGPLALVSLGLRGGWPGNLTALEPFRPVFIGAALIALFLVYGASFRPAAECKPDEVCARPPDKARAYKVMFGVQRLPPPSRAAEKVLVAEQLPEHLIVYGGSVVAVDLGQAFQRLGSKVTLIARSTLLSKTDPAIIGEGLNRRSQPKACAS